MEDQGEGFAGNEQLSEELEQVFQEEPLRKDDDDDDDDESTPEEDETWDHFSDDRHPMSVTVIYIINGPGPGGFTYDLSRQYRCHDLLCCTHITAPYFLQGRASRFLSLLYYETTAYSYCGTDAASPQSRLNGRPVQLDCEHFATWIVF